jgi:hypothetical protein
VTDVHVDFAASTPELMIWAATVRGSPRVAEMVQHVPEQGRNAGMVQPVATKPSVGPMGGVGVVVHLSKTNQHFIHRTKTTNQNSK